MNKIEKEAVELIKRTFSKPAVHINDVKEIAVFIKEHCIDVVRCKECEHYLAGMCMRKIGPRNSGFKMEEDDYCSRGVRK